MGISLKTEKGANEHGCFELNQVLGLIHSSTDLIVN